VTRKIFLSLAALVFSVSGSALACEYKPGETRFADYANCRYGSEAVVVVDLPEDSPWEQCVYVAEAFRPPKLLAVTRNKNGREEASINSRGNIGNPCYLSKSTCDRAYKEWQANN
jgi:hypothetical protein